MSGNISLRYRQRKQQIGYKEAAGSNQSRDRLLQACCGHDSSCNISNAGATLLSDHWQQCMLKCQDVTTDLLNNLWNQETSSDYQEQQLRLSCKVVEAIKTATAQTTVDDIVGQIFPRLNTTEGETDKNVARHLVFATIGWTSTLYTTSFPSSLDADFSVVREPSGTIRKQQLTQSAQRPIGALLRSCDLMPLACPLGGVTSPTTPNLLAVTHLNMFSLSRLGGVSIKWVNDLSEHCSFDRFGKEKTLKLYRIPSVCADMSLNKDNKDIISCLFKAHTCNNRCRSCSDTIARQYLVEVLLSYRLLFGQQGNARDMFRTSELKKAYSNGRIDQLLVDLCSEKDMGESPHIRRLLNEGLLRERNVYNAHISFPHLSPRLIELADYSKDQKPKNLWEVWYDVRDPERTWTFRAALVIGTSSVMLSFLQVLVAFIQLGTSSK